MSNQYIYNGYQQQYSPSITHGSLHGMGTSPTFNNVKYMGPNSVDSTTSSASSSIATSFSGASSISLHAPRLRYYLSKSFDVEDDLVFCPDIPEGMLQTSPSIKKFNPYTATVFSPKSAAESIAAAGGHEPSSPMNNRPQLPRAHTPRLRRPLEIVNPQTKMKIGASTVHSDK